MSKTKPKTAKLGASSVSRLVRETARPEAAAWQRLWDARFVAGGIQTNDQAAALVQAAQEYAGVVQRLIPNTERIDKKTDG